jgi:hypothetical protein
MSYEHLVVVKRPKDLMNDTRSTFISDGSSSSSLTTITKVDILEEDEPEEGSLSSSARTMLEEKEEEDVDSSKSSSSSSCSTTIASPENEDEDEQEGDETTTTTAVDDDENESDHSCENKIRTAASKAAEVHVAAAAAAEQAPVVVSTNTIVIPEASNVETASKNSNSKKSKKQKKSVSWSNIFIYEHAITLGDSPAVSCGPPIALDTRKGSSSSSCLQQAITIAISDYEAHRPPRRVKAQLAMPRMDREDLLLRNGYGRSDLRLAVEQVQRIKKLRQASAKGNIFERLHRWATSSCSNSKASIRRRATRLQQFAPKGYD